MLIKEIVFLDNNALTNFFRILQTLRFLEDKPIKLWKRRGVRTNLIINSIFFFCKMNLFLCPIVKTDIS